MGYNKLKSKEDILQHLRIVRKRKEEWKKRSIADYQELMRETEQERNQLYAAVIN